MTVKEKNVASAVVQIGNIPRIVIVPFTNRSDGKCFPCAVVPVSQIRKGAWHFHGSDSKTVQVAVEAVVVFYVCPVSSPTVLIDTFKVIGCLICRFANQNIVFPFVVTDHQLHIPRRRLRPAEVLNMILRSARGTAVIISKRHIIFIVSSIKSHKSSILFQLTHTLGGRSSLSRLLQCRQKHRGEDCDNRNYHEQFYKVKLLIRFFGFRVVIFCSPFIWGC